MKHLLIALFAFAAFPALAGNSEENIACKSDNECVVLQSVCPGDWAASNVNRVAQTQSYYNSMKGKMRCVGIQGKKPSASCLEGSCSLYMP